MTPPLVLMFACLPVLAAQDVSSPQAMATGAKEFLASLDDAQRQRAVFAFNADERENFRFTPQTRSGLPLKDMNPDQRAAALDLLGSALSERGKLKATQIMLLESVLGELEKRPDFRDAGKYYVSIFGNPGETAGWGWKFEGHHLALNYTVRNGRAAVTPSFFGANPAEVRDGPHRGLRVLKAEDELAHELVLSLLESNRKEVIFSDKAPAEILSGESRKATALQPVGVAAAHMTPQQQQLLLGLIGEYTGRHRKDLAEADLQKITRAGIDKIQFGWAGGTKPGEAWYYRIQGPTFLMEAANTQNQANHIHATWRDFTGDFGHDILGQHYKEHE